MNIIGGGGGGIWHGDGPSPKDIAKVNASPLVRVVAIGQQAHAANIRFELIAFEMRQAGAFLYWRAIAPDGQLLGLPAIEVHDNEAREYQVSAGGLVGGDDVWQGQTCIIPALGSGVQRLRVNVSGFARFEPRIGGFASKPADQGPWVFEFAV